MKVRKINVCVLVNTDMSKFHCCVPLFANDSRYNSALSLHRFPSSLELRRQWIVKFDRMKETVFRLGKPLVRDHFLCCI